MSTVLEALKEAIIEGEDDLAVEETEKALEEGKRAVTICPNDPMSYYALAWAKYFNGNFQEALTLCEKAERLCPYLPTGFFIYIGLVSQNGRKRTLCDIQCVASLLEVCFYLKTHTGKGTLQEL